MRAPPQDHPHTYQQAQILAVTNALVTCDSAATASITLTYHASVTYRQHMA